MKLKLLPQCQEGTHSAFHVSHGSAASDRHLVHVLQAVLEAVADVKEAVAVAIELEELTAKMAVEVMLGVGLSPAVTWEANQLCWAQGHLYPS